MVAQRLILFNSSKNCKIYKSVQWSLGMFHLLHKFCFNNFTPVINLSVTIKIHAEMHVGHHATSAVV